jgi:ligand-binding SRPBCC domain-containing protein
METLTQTTLINCTLEEIFNFHLDTNNIKLITPSHTKVELIDYNEKTYEGKIIKLKTTRLLMPIIWMVKIEKFEYPNLIVDMALKSPFVFWEHSHIFTQRGPRCELKDVVRYELPFGIFGKLIGPFLRKDIENMFAFRHKQTKMILET